MSNNILEPIPASLNDYLLKYNATVLSDTIPAAPSGSTNITWQRDQFGNVSAYATAGGSNPPANLSLVATNAEGVLEQASSFELGTGEGTLSYTFNGDASTITLFNKHSGNAIGLLATIASAPIKTIGIGEAFDGSHGNDAALATYSPNVFGTSIPIFTTFCSGVTSAGFGNSPFTVNADATVQTYYNYLDDGSGNVSIVGTGNGLRIGYPSLGAPSANIDIADGSANQLPPIRIPTQATLITTPLTGSFEFDGTNLHFTVGGVRKTVTLT